VPPEQVRDVVNGRGEPVAWWSEGSGISLDVEGIDQAGIHEVRLAPSSTQERGQDVARPRAE
jgi:hypothetical protein